jgi:hypothetical protein
VLTFRLRRDGTVELVVRRANCSVLGRKRVDGDRGLNRVRFNGRLHGRPLAPGRYTIDLVVIRGHARTRFGAVAVQVVPPDARLNKAQRTEPLVNDCTVAINAPGLPLALASTAGPLAAGGMASSEPQPSAAKNRTRTRVLGVGLKPPQLSLPGTHVAPLWLGVMLLVLFAAAIWVLAVCVMRLVRGSWAP